MSTVFPSRDRRLGTSLAACSKPEGHVPLADARDCDDTDSSVHPAAEEVRDDGVDQDCDGEDAEGEGTRRAVDEGCGGCAVRRGAGGWLVLSGVLGLWARRIVGRPRPVPRLF